MPPLLEKFLQSPMFLLLNNYYCNFTFLNAIILSSFFLNLTDAWKEHEFLIIGTEASDEWLELFYQVYRLFVEDFKVFCWSTGIVLPPMANLQSPLGAVARISSRYAFPKLIFAVTPKELLVNH
jgi:hypothetical protein